jgi:hypothetical protein
LNFKFNKKAASFITGYKTVNPKVTNQQPLMNKSPVQTETTNLIKNKIIISPTKSPHPLPLHHPLPIPSLSSFIPVNNNTKVYPKLPTAATVMGQDSNIQSMNPTVIYKVESSDVKRQIYQSSIQKSSTQITQINSKPPHYTMSRLNHALNEYMPLNETKTSSKTNSTNTASQSPSPSLSQLNKKIKSSNSSPIITKVSRNTQKTTNLTGNKKNEVITL